MNTYIFTTEFGEVCIDAANFISAYDQLSVLYPDLVGELNHYSIVRYGMEGKKIGEN